MKCPICGKDLDLQNKQIGTSENGDPIFNEYAICHSCKKQWNLDKQRAKKIAAKKAAEEKADDRFLRWWCCHAGREHRPYEEKWPCCFTDSEA